MGVQLIHWVFKSIYRSSLNDSDWLTLCYIVSLKIKSVLWNRYALYLNGGHLNFSIIGWLPVEDISKPVDVMKDEVTSPPHLLLWHFLKQRWFNNCEKLQHFCFVHPNPWFWLCNVVHGAFLILSTEGRCEGWSESSDTEHPAHQHDPPPPSSAWMGICLMFPLPLLLGLLASLTVSNLHTHIRHVIEEKALLYPFLL